MTRDEAEWRGFRDRLCEYLTEAQAARLLAVRFQGKGANKGFRAGMIIRSPKDVLMNCFYWQMLKLDYPVSWATIHASLPDSWGTSPAEHRLGMV